MGMTLLERLWSLLPDECEVDGCCRKGMRGNEVINYPWPEQYEDIGIIMCDYCNSKYMHGDVLYVSGNMPMMVKGTGVVLSFGEVHRRKKREDEV